MKPRLLHPAAGLLALALAAAACNGRPEPTEQPPAQASKQAADEPARLPDFALADFEGKTVSSEAFRGKVLIVDFWATWCGPCEKEMPGFDELHRRLGERGLAVVGIAMDTNPQDVKKFAQRLGVSYPLLMGTPEVFDKFGIQGLPTTLVVDRAGIVRKRVVGFEYKEEFEKAVRALL